MNKNLDGRVIGVKRVVDHGKISNALFLRWTTSVTKIDSRYYSNIVISGREENPMCMWIDANKDQPVTAFQLHFADFVSKDGQFPHDED